MAHENKIQNEEIIFTDVKILLEKIAEKIKQIEINRKILPDDLINNAQFFSGQRLIAQVRETAEGLFFDTVYTDSGRLVSGVAPFTRDDGARVLNALGFIKI